MVSLPCADMDLRARIGSLVQCELDARRVAISRELASIPPPVPACDVDFNRLLEDRGRVVDDLRRLHRLLAIDGTEAEILDLCRSTEFLSDAVKREVETLLVNAARR